MAKKIQLKSPRFAKRRIKSPKLTQMGCFREQLGGGAITDRETRAKNASGNGPLAMFERFLNSQVQNELKNYNFISFPTKQVGAPTHGYATSVARPCRTILCLRLSLSANFDIGHVMSFHATHFLSFYVIHVILCHLMLFRSFMSSYRLQSL
jgi:hypothetical protein